MVRVPAFPFPVEFERDSDGNYIPDDKFGYKLTAESMEIWRKWHAEWFKGWEPMAELPEHFRVSSQHPADTLPRMLFGFPLTFEQAYEYAVRRKLKLLDEAARYCYRMPYAAMKTIEDLDRRTGADLRYELPWTEGCHFMICMYTNLTLARDELEEEEEKEVIEMIMKELRLTEPPKWYWDARFTQNQPSRIRRFQ